MAILKNELSTPSRLDLAAALVGGALACLSATNSAQAAAFTAGDLVIYRVGDGSAAPGATATAVFLDEYTTSGALVQSIAIPSSGAGMMTAVGNASTEGIMSLSGDGTRLIFTGYSKALGGANPSSDAGTTTPRILGSVNAFGIVDTSISLTDASGTIRSATTFNGSSFYAGTSAGVRYVGTPSSGTSTLIDSRNSRQVLLNGPTLFASNGSTATTAKVQSYGDNPTGTTTPTALVNLASSDAVNGMAFFDLSSSVAGIDTLYALSTAANQLLKFTYDGTAWNASGSISASSCQNLTGMLNGTTVDLYLTSGTALFHLADASGYGGTESGTLTSLVTAPANTAFRGIGPTVVPEPSSLALVLLGGGLMLIRRRKS